jgi:hypothetical protein
MISGYLLIIYIATSSGTILLPQAQTVFTSEYECKAAADQVLAHAGPDTHTQCIAQVK